MKGEGFKIKVMYTVVILWGPFPSILGPPTRWGPGQNAPVAPPVGGPASKSLQVLSSLIQGYVMVMAVFKALDLMHTPSSC